MSLLVNYTLKSDDHFDAQVSAMKVLVDGLKSEGIAGLNYSGFSTDDHRRFLGLLEFPDDATKQRFLTSAAFANYRETVGPTLQNPPETTKVEPIASTRY